MNINWFIASFLSLGLMIFFLTRKGVLRGINLRSFFSTTVRPFEGWLNVPFEANILGVIGSRPTGLARYAAIASLVMLCLFTTYHSWYWLFAFLVFAFILLFSKGKMEMLSFIVVMGFILFVTHNLSSPLILVYIFITWVSFVILFGNIPYYVSKPVKQEKFEETAVVIDSPKEVIVSFPQKTFNKRITTLSGRTSIWSGVISLIKKSPLFGYGFNVEKYLIKNYEGKPGSVDSTLLNIILQSGFIGTTLFIISIAWSVFIACQILVSDNHSLVFLESASIGIFILLRGITQSFSGYSADWIFLVPILAYFSFR